MDIEERHRLFEQEQGAWYSVPQEKKTKVKKPKPQPIDWVKEREDFENRIIAAGAEEKYSHAGIYCIKLDDKYAYIGKSKNMLARVASHMMNIENCKATEYNSKKYKLLRIAKEEGHQIDFDVLFYCKEEDLDEFEGRAIREHRPPLNTQIPKVEGGWEVNNIQNLTLPQLLSLLEGEQICLEN